VLLIPGNQERSTKTESCVLSAEPALSSVGKEMSSCNWVLLEPAKLELHKAGCGGLDELKENLPADQVMFGVLCFSFPRKWSPGAPPIVKCMFIHWIGPQVSVVRRGQWNSKLEQAASKVRQSCDFAFRKTAYSLDDLDLARLIHELGRVTCVTSSDTRQLSVSWYAEGVEIARKELALQQPTEAANDSCNDEPLRQSVKHAIHTVREGGRHWKWVLLTFAECGSENKSSPFSGGA